MRKVRDYDAELKSLNEKTRALKAKKVQQMGELVAATGAGELDLEILAGLLINGAQTTDETAKEAWRAKGAAFFQRGRKTIGGARRNPAGATSAGDGHAPG